ncbi:imelysin family protein [Cribrihabitans sp. XS_ASV171]
MMLRAALLALLLPCAVLAAPADTVRATVEGHILPRINAFAQQAQALRDAAQADCTALRPAFTDAFDAWISMSHLRFGPTETGERGFALAFWPDTRGFTPRALAGLIEAEDPAVEDPDSFAQVSIAARGFYALEFLLYDATLSTLGPDAYRCTLLRAITADIARLADAIRADWTPGFARAMTQPSEEGRYRTDEEAIRELYKALDAGLQFTADTRLGRPLGSFDQPRPNRAEARRSGRSLHHVTLSLAALRDLAAYLAQDHPQAAREVDAAFARALDRAATLDDPSFAGVAEPAARLRVEALQQAVQDIRDTATTALAPALGVDAGFNSLDGD